MLNVLEKIVNDKRVEVEKRKKTLPLDQFIDGLVPTQKSFFEALATSGSRFILECKKASPSKGLIRDPFDLDEILNAYTPHADCISVLTDEKYFQGTFEYLQYVTERVSQPVINKDFFIDEYQVHLARYYQADAILLMLSVLTDDEYRELADIANNYNMAILTEVSNEEEMTRAINLKANIIGINNRNLRDLSTDLATTERLVPMLKDVDFKHIIISESGIYTHDDVTRLAPICDGFLVGSSLMSERDVSTAVTRLIYPTIKICGITTVQQAQWVKDSPAKFAGLIFAEKSKRAISLADAQVITTAVPQRYVGVFVDADIDTIVNYALSLQLSAVQLHGSESLETVKVLQKQLPTECQIWKAFGISDVLPGFLQEANSEWYTHTDKVLLDCKVGQQQGGTGQSFDWTLLDDVANKSHIILAGGISPDNCAYAISTGVSFLDVNSGVEHAPGQKDINKLNALFSALRQHNTHMLNATHG